MLKHLSKANCRWTDAKISKVIPGVYNSYSIPVISPKSQTLLIPINSVHTVGVCKKTPNNTYIEMSMKL